MLVAASHIADNYPLLFSMTVHEALDCVVDQARNFARFAPGAAIVYHVNRSAPFDINALAEALAPVTGLGLYVNPDRLEVAWDNGTILRAHVSNLNAVAVRELGHRRVSFEASNTLFVRDGVLDYIASHPCGYRRAGPAEKFLEKVGWEHKALEDWEFEAYIGERPRVFQIEGSWFCRELFEPVRQELVYYLACHGGATNYWTEEVYPFMLWEKHHPWLQPARTFTMVLYEHWMFPTKDDAAAIHFGEYRHDNFYAVKRVPRVYDHPVREFIRHLGGY